MVLVHATLSVPGLSGVTRALGVRGRFGVQMFYVLSACTLMLSCQSRRRRDRRPTSAFYARRVTRVVPLFLAAVAFYLAWNGVGPRPSAPDGVGPVEVGLTVVCAHGWYPTAINAAPGGR